MRHRRRTNTQLMTTKKSLQAKRRHFPKKSNSFGGFLKFVFVLIVVAGLLYVGYSYLLPVVKEKLPALKELTSRESPMPEKSEERPQLPSEAQTGSETVQEETRQPETFLPNIQVEILNGCGEQGIAKILADKLMSLKYDVVNTGNYLKKGKPFFEVEKTRIINQVDSEKTREKARKLAQQIGIPEEQVEFIANPNPIADITIVIGKDFKSLEIFKGKGE